MDFNDASSKYARLKQQYEQGRINAQEFERQANEITVTDSTGNLWQIGVKTGKWYRYNGQNWVEDAPGESHPAVQAAPNPPPPLEPIPVQPRSSSFNWLWIIGGLAALGVVGCVVLVIGLFVFNQNNPAPQVDVVTTVVAQPASSTPQAYASSPQVGQTAGPGFDPNAVFFTDEFSDPASGWDRHTDANGITEYENGKYRILVNKSSTLIWANPHKNFNGPVGIEVDVTKSGGPDKNEFGVICGYRDAANYYRFMISSDGYAGIVRIKDGQHSYLLGDKLQPADAIRQGAATNHIRADCAGSEMTLSVNQQKIVGASDPSYSGGDIGLIAGSYDTPGVDILFDAFFAYP